MVKLDLLPSIAPRPCFPVTYCGCFSSCARNGKEVQLPLRPCQRRQHRHQGGSIKKAWVLVTPVWYHLDSDADSMLVIGSGFTQPNPT
jgi:hypothetical protein